ncbi:MAG TPA: TonB family protein [Candidatus Acidoferrales bacterium]|nr:TonB family protein [Candidatus Acidoferrales bacterium]
MASVLAVVVLGASVLMAQTANPPNLPTRIVAGGIPVYPAIARAAGISGTVRLNVKVHNGKVGDVSFVSASSKAAEKWLVANARQCAASWEFPDETTGTVPVEFVYVSAPPGTADAISIHFAPGKGIRVSLQSARPKPVVMY